LLTVYGKTIAGRLVEQLDGRRTLREHQLDDKLKGLDAQSARSYAQMSADTLKLTEYVPGNAALRRLQAEVEQTNAAAAALDTVKQQKLQKLEKAKEGLEGEQEVRQKKLESVLIEMDRERDGKRDSGKDGKGDVWRSLMAAKAAASMELERVSNRIREVNAQIDSTDNDRSTDTVVVQRLPTESQASASPVGQGLSSDEAAAKEHLEAEIKRLNDSLEAIAVQRDAVWKEKSGLKDEYALPKHDDSLAEFRVLCELIAENPVLRVKVAALFLLVFLIDLTPILAKLTANTGYEKYLRSEARRRSVRAQPDRIKYRSSVTSEGAKTASQLCDYLKNVSSHCEASFPSDECSAHLHAIRSKVGKALLRDAGRVVDGVENVDAPERRPGSLSPPFRILGYMWSMLRAKLG
jgi:hypothetical protein